MLELDAGKSFYRNIGIDTVATIVNDLITTGALPISVAMHAAVGDSAWFAERARAPTISRDGFAEGCRAAGAVWGGGETPTLEASSIPTTIVLAGSRDRADQAEVNRIAGDVRDGDAIILLASTGVQTNGLTLCRAIADRLPEGYLDDSIATAERMARRCSTPSVIYVRVRRRVPARRRSAALRRPHHRPRLAEADAAGRAVRLSRSRRSRRAAAACFDFIDRARPGRARARCTRRSTWASASRPTCPRRGRLDARRCERRATTPGSPAACERMARVRRWSCPP